VLEAVIEALVAETPRSVLEAARAAFEERGGAFSTGDAFHEERIRAFSDELVCDVRMADGLTPAERARAMPHSDAEAGWIEALTRSERSLFRVEIHGARPVLRCLLGGALYAVALDLEPRDPAARLREGDVFDGRIAPLGGAIRVLPGMVFHREEAHEALFALLPRTLAAGLARRAILDGLLRMRMRHDHFTSIHARHLYRADALETREIQAASWKPLARRGKPSDEPAKPSDEPTKPSDGAATRSDEPTKPSDGAATRSDGAARAGSDGDRRD
jgi:hypothetical protein